MSIFYSTPVDRAHNASLPGVPFKLKADSQSLRVTSFKSRLPIAQSYILLLQPLMAKAVVAHLILATAASQCISNLLQQQSVLCSRTECLMSKYSCLTGQRIIIIKRISRMPIYCTKWEQGAVQ